MMRKDFYKLAIGHTLNDQAETILMRIIRGTSHTGLGGMRPYRADGIVRPLLDVSRDQVRAFLDKNHIRYCEDSSNDSLYYMRNRIRKTILPLLKGENPMIVNALMQLSKSVNRVEALITSLVLEKQADILLDHSKTFVVFDYTGFMELDIEIRNRIIKFHWYRLCLPGIDKHLQFRHLVSVDKLLGSAGNRFWEVHLPSEVIVKRQAGELVIERREDNDSRS
jgi:tRNA(Ile)-lysidine synthase